MAKVETVGSVQIQRGDGITLNFNLAFVYEQASLVGKEFQVRMVIKNVKTFKQPDTDAEINMFMSNVTSNSVSFNLSPDDTFKLSSKDKYYLALKVSVVDLKLSAGVAYDLVVTDPVVTSLL